MFGVVRLIPGFWVVFGQMLAVSLCRFPQRCGLSALLLYLLILLIILLNSLPVGHIMSFKTISYDLYVNDIQLYRSVNPNWIMVS